MLFGVDIVGSNAPLEAGTLNEAPPEAGTFDNAAAGEAVKIGKALPEAGKLGAGDSGIANVEWNSVGALGKLAWPVKVNLLGSSSAGSERRPGTTTCLLFLSSMMEAMLAISGLKASRSSKLVRSLS